MKKLSFALLIALCVGMFAFTSCGDAEEAPAGPTAAEQGGAPLEPLDDAAPAPAAEAEPAN